MRASIPVAVLAMALLAGCSSNGSGETTETVSLSIRGTVVDAAIRPIVGATVTLDGGITNTTSSDGSFAFPDVAQGLHTLVASAPGYLPAQAAANAVEAVDLRITLETIPLPSGYNQTYQFDGFFEVGTGVGNVVLGRLPGDLSNGTACRCSFTVDADGPVRAFVVEAVWEDSIPMPDNATAYRWRLSTESPPTTISAYRPSPIRVEVNGGAFDGAARQFVVGLDPDALWPAFQQEFEVALSIFYDQAPAPGFGVLS